MIWDLLEDLGFGISDLEFTSILDFRFTILDLNDLEIGISDLEFDFDLRFYICLTIHDSPLTIHDSRFTISLLTIDYSPFTFHDSDFIEVRMKGEDLIRQSGMNATFIRPWYVLGPGHYWSCILIPFYKLFELIPATRETAVPLGLIKIGQMVRCIFYAVKNPPIGFRTFKLRDIQKKIKIWIGSNSANFSSH